MFILIKSGIPSGDSKLIEYRNPLRQGPAQCERGKMKEKKANVIQIGYKSKLNACNCLKGSSKARFMRKKKGI